MSKLSIFFSKPAHSSGTLFVLFFIYSVSTVSLLVTNLRQKETLDNVVLELFSCQDLREAEIQTQSSEDVDSLDESLDETDWVGVTGP